MGSDVDSVIAKLKKRYRAESDQQLAEKLSLGRSTVAGWRNRNSVPRRYAEQADGFGGPSYQLPFPMWTSDEEAVIRLALLRLVRDFQPAVADYETFLLKGVWIVPQFLKYTHDALLDVSAEMEKRNLNDTGQCVQMMIYREFFGAK